MTAGDLVQFNEVRGGGSYQSQNDLRLHFGLGNQRKAQTVEILWPGGQKEVLRELDADFIYTLVEGQGVGHKLGFAAPGP